MMAPESGGKGVPKYLPAKTGACQEKPEKRKRGCGFTPIFTDSFWAVRAKAKSTTETLRHREGQATAKGRRGFSLPPFRQNRAKGWGNQIYF
jgi:hypothetical protein